MKRPRCILTALALTVAVACGGGGSSTPTPTVTSGRPTSTAKLAIIGPTAGQMVPTSGTTVKISLRDAVIVEQVSTNIKPNEGHVHLRVDGKTITLLGGLETTTGALTAGDHLIEVEFVAADHGPFNPRVIAQVTVIAG